MMKSPRSLLGLAVLLALVVRSVGVNFGLPFVYHDDEPIIVNYALAYGSGDFNPHMFNVPPLLSYLLFLMYGAFCLAGMAAGLFANVKEFGYLFLSDPTMFYLIGRVALGVIPGTLSVLLIYFLGKRVFGKEAGLLSAFFLALNFLHVRDSHYIYFDIPLVFLLTALLAKSMDMVSANRARDHLWAGVLLGAVTATKYFGPAMALFFGAVFLHNLLYYRERASAFFGKLALFSAASVVTFFCLNPFALLDWREFIRQLSAIPVSPVAAWFHLKVSLAGAAGRAMLIFGALGMILSFLKGKKQAMLISVFCVSYYFLLMARSQPAERYVMPLIPPLMLFAAYFLLSITEAIKKPLPRAAAVTLVSCALVLPSAWKVLLLDSILLREDTRTQAYRWVKENVPAGAALALDATSSGFPRLEKSKEQLTKIYTAPSDTTFDMPSGALDSKREMILSNPRYPEDTYILYYLKEEGSGGFHAIYPDIAVEIGEVTGNGVEYVLLSNITVHDTHEAFKKDLKDNADLVASFSPYRDGINRTRPQEETAVPAAAFSMKELRERAAFGPYIEVYKIRR